jgi:hypothetical protein
MDGSDGQSPKARKSFERAKPYVSPWIPMSSAELLPVREDLIRAAQDGTVVARGRFCPDADDDPGELQDVPQDAWRSLVDWDGAVISLDGPAEHYWVDISWRRAELEDLFSLSERPKAAVASSMPLGRPPKYDVLIAAAAALVADGIDGIDDTKNQFVDKILARLAEMLAGTEVPLPDQSTIRRSPVIKRIYEERAKGKRR